MEERFEIVSEYQPTGDQPQAIESLVEGLQRQEHMQTLLGVTGSGKTFTVANVIAAVNKPTLILAHNKTLAAQLCSEFREFFPDNACGLRDSRVRIFYEDGLKFLRTKSDDYDLIINDCTDPLGHAAGLFTKEFYGSCFKALHEDGIMVYQHGSPFYDEDEETCRAMHKRAYRSFPISRVYQAHIPTCPAGYWLFGFASKKYHPLKDFNAARWNARHIKTWYYSTHLHRGAFMLPRYVEELLEEEENG